MCNGNSLGIIFLTKLFKPFIAQFTASHFGRYFMLILISFYIKVNDIASTTQLVGNSHGVLLIAI